MAFPSLHSSEMDPTPNRITFSSHNVRGFNGSKDFLLALCDKFPNAVRAIQEHWLAPPYKKQCGVNRLRSVHPNFDGFGNSAMKKISESEVRTGRPFGGTGFLFNKKHSNCIKPMVNYYHERVSVMNLSADVGEIVLINGYLPFYKTSDLQNQRIIYQETLAYIENIINDHLGSHFILLLDMNCNIYNTGHPYSILLRDLMSRKSLFSAFDLVPNFDPSANFTRCDLKTNSFTLIDGILLSDSLRDLVSNVRVES